MQRHFAIAKQCCPDAGGWRGVEGQSVVEFAVVLPLILLLCLGVMELGYALYEDHMIVAMAREGSNLISRTSTIQEAETAMLQAVHAPLDFNQNGRLIFSVVKLGTGGSNLNLAIISQRRVIGSLAGNSMLGMPPGASYNGTPDYMAVNADNDTNIRMTGSLPNGYTLSAGQSVYVTEIYTRHNLLTPAANFGITLPTNLYAAAYF
ncbi:MAG: TadE/TadG family type IV pilus assembly protein [Terriglobia bacterium]